MSRNNLLISIMITGFAQRFASSFLVSNVSLRRAAFATTARSTFLHHSPKVTFKNRITTSKKNICAPASTRNASTSLMNATEEIQEQQKNLESTWDVPELRKEIARLVLRCMKKIGKASSSLSKANEIVEELRTNPDTTQEELEACPDVRSLENNLADLKDRLAKLNRLEEKLPKKGKNVVLPEDVASLALELEVNDAPPKRAPRGPKKKKGPRTETPRKPYFKYYSSNKTEIRVGRRSEDNDELSCNPEHGDGPDWWMHASGCPGSHVVIRCHDAQLDKDVKMDAAALAARQSKCEGSTIKVSLTRWRDVKKPPGAKPGLVQLTGKVETVSVNMKEAAKRLERLDKTKM